MSKWCRNLIEVSKGDAKEVFDSIRGADSLFDFNQLIPMPTDVENSDDDAYENWCVQNWGTEWNAVEPRYLTDRKVIRFDTASSPPGPVFEALAKKFPTHELLMYSDDHDRNRHLTFTAKDGNVTSTQDPSQRDLAPLTLYDALKIADKVGVGRIGRCWPPEFGIVIPIEGVDEPLVYGGFSSREAAGNAIDSFSAFDPPATEPEDAMIDYRRRPGDIDCGATEDGTRFLA
jgi:hypothetical protein